MLKFKEIVAEKIMGVTMNISTDGQLWMGSNSFHTAIGWGANQPGQYMLKPHEGLLQKADWTHPRSTRGKNDAVITSHIWVISYDGIRQAVKDLCLTEVEIEAINSLLQGAMDRWPELRLEFFDTVNRASESDEVKMNEPQCNGELTVTVHDGQMVVDSRDVAVMVGKEHKNLLADIRGYVAVLERRGELNFQPTDFFIESAYISGQNKELPCYLLTKKGCDMVANKMTGEKGVLFTATYINKFYEMEDALKNAPINPNRPYAVEPFIFEEANALLFTGLSSQQHHSLDFTIREAIYNLTVAVASKTKDFARKETWKRLYDGIADGFCINILARDRGNKSYLDTVDHSEWFMFAIQATRMAIMAGYEEPQIAGLIGAELAKRFMAVLDYYEMAKTLVQAQAVLLPRAKLHIVS